MNKHVFVTGIGTDVGKTVCSAILTQALQCDYWKPIQAGDLNFTDSNKIAQWVQNEKTKIWKEAHRLTQPMSPHAAARHDGVELTSKNIPFPKTNNTLLIEGAGGIMVPISKTENIIDLIPNTTPVVLISQNYLGSINHTLLSVEVLKSKGYKRCAILFNGTETPTTESIIKKRSGFTILGRIPMTKAVDSEFIDQEARKIKANMAAFMALD